jgi:RimJ/RimL family protein N-acetyltransferase
MASPNSRIWILEFKKKPVAQIRYDRVDQETARISYSVDTQVRGQGFGTAALARSLPLATRELCVQRFVGVTFRDNRASHQAFLKAGFDLIDEPILAGHSCLVFQRPCVTSAKGR